MNDEREECKICLRKADCRNMARTCCILGNFALRVTPKTMLKHRRDIEVEDLRDMVEEPAEIQRVAPED